MKKIMMLLGAGIFMISQLCFAASVEPAKIAVSRDNGRIVEVYAAKEANAPLVVYMQDIHMNYEAQKAEAAVLGSLIRDYGFDLVLLEGKEANTTADFKYLRGKSSREARMKGAEDLLKDGTISAVNYLDLTTDYSFAVNGVENLDLYKKETADHMAIYGNTEAMSKLVAALRNIASNLKLHIYTKEMRDLDDQAAAYDKDEIGLVEYVKFLDAQAKANSIDTKAFTNVAQFLDSAALEGQINFPAVETERQAVMDTVEKTLTGAAKDDFAAKNLQFRTGDISQGAFYSYLKNAAQAAKVDMTAQKNLDLYTTYITAYEKIDTTLLFKEVDTLSNNIKEALIKTPEQRQLNQIDRGLAIVNSFVNTKLVPDEYNYLQAHKAEFDLDSWAAFLKNNSGRFSLTAAVPEDISVLKNNLPLLETFYQTAFDRDNAFMANIKATMAKLGKDKAIFVGGGFHTPNMKKLLRENGFSYVIVAPRVDVIRSYENIYKERSKADLDYMNKMVPAAAAAQKPVGAGNRAPFDAANRADLAGKVEAVVSQSAGNAGLQPVAQQLQALSGQLREAQTANDRTRIDAILAETATLVQNAGFMGKFNLKPGTQPTLNRDAANNIQSVTMTVVPVAGGAERTVTIGARQRTAEEFTTAMQPALQAQAEPIRTGVQTAVTGFTGVFLELDANQEGIFGFELPNMIAVSAGVGDMPAAFLHEGLHLARRANTVSRDALLAQVGGATAAVDASGRTFEQVAGTLAGNDEMLDHYAIRAATFGTARQADVALSNRINTLQHMQTGQGAVTEQLKGRQYTIAVPKGAGTAENLMQLPIVQDMIQAGAQVSFETVVTAGDVERVVTAAGQAGRTAMVVADAALSDSLVQSAPAALKGVPTLRVEDFNPTNDTGERVTGTMDLVVVALAQIDLLRNQADPLAHPAAQSLRDTLALLRGAEVTMTEVMGILPLKGEDNTAARLKLVAQLRLLPRATPLTPMQTQEIVAQRMQARSA